MRGHGFGRRELWAFLLVMAATGGAHAQVPSAAASPPVVPSAAPRGNLEEIVVTAQKRRETVRSVPESVSVLSGTQLQARQITTFEDLTRATPGLSFAAGGGPGLDNIEIRGISSTSGNATVGIYLDEVPITVSNLYNGAIEPTFFDLARVEVLRGPQGTLFGSSSMGGTLRFISNPPVLDNFSGYSATTLSGTRRGGLNEGEEAVVNMPLIPGQLALRIGADYTHDSGWIDNYNAAGQLDNAGTNGVATGVFRASLLYQPSEDWTIVPAVYYEKQRVDDTAVYYPDLGLYNQNKEVTESSQIALVVASLDVTRDLGFANLTSITGYFQEQFNRIQDGTFYNSEYLGGLIAADPPPGPASGSATIGGLPGPQYSHTTTSQFSQEFRLTSKTPEQSGLPFTWIAGLFTSSQTIHQAVDAFVNGLDQSFEQIYGIPIQDSNVFAGSPFPSDSVDIAYEHNHDQEYAAFGQATYLPIPAVKISAGLRYTYAVETSALYTTGYFAGSTPPAYLTRAEFYALTPKFTASYDMTDTTTLYADIAKGFRVGGGAPYVPTDICANDLAGIGLSEAPRSYGSDKLWSYETGLKGRYFGGKLTVAGDIFLIDWTNIQQTLSLPTCGYTVTTNVGNAQSYGGEFEARGQITDDIALHVSLGTVHAVLTSVATSFGPQVGQSILNSPNWNLAVGAEYRHGLNDTTQVFASIDNDWTGESHGSYTTSNPDYLRPDYNVVNMAAGIDYRQFEVSVFAKNMLDNTQIIQHPALLFVNEGYTLRPLTVGARVLVKF